VHDSGAQADDYVKCAAGRRHYDQAAGESLGQHSCGRSNTKMVGDGEVELPQSAGVSHAGVVKIPAQVLRGLIAPDRVRDFK